MAGAWQRWWYGDDQALVAAAVGERRGRNLQAAALSLRAGRDVILPRYELWQDEAWAYWGELGEVYYGVRWLSEMLSRIRLVAATTPDSPGDEPALLETDGTAKDLVARFAGGLGGQSEVLRRLAVQLSVPGEGWLVGEPTIDGDPDGEGDRWMVRSADEIRRSAREPTRSRRRGRGGQPPLQELPRAAGSALARVGARRPYSVEVVDENNPPGGDIKWRILPTDSLVSRIWNPHDRHYTHADSPVRHALTTARKLQLANRYIQAQFLSRLASAGVFVLPDNIDIPVSEQFEGQDDAVIKEWIHTAATAVKNPGSAASIVPILFQLPPDVIDKLKFIDFTTAFDDRILEKREGAVRELATILDLPAEVLLGMGDTNHWTAWQLEEGGIKVHIAPRMETICHAFTDGWYRPMLKELGEDPAKYLVWYDPSEIVVRPDKSEKALNLYDRGEASGDALRRESGMDESDKPEDEDLREWALKQLILGKGGPELVPVAYKELTGDELEVPEPAPAPAVPGPGRPGDQPPEDGEANQQRREPGTQAAEPPPPDDGAVRQAAQAALATMTAPGTGWPMERRPDGLWYVLNVNHWLSLGPERSAIIDRHQEAISATMNGGRP